MSNDDGVKVVEMKYAVALNKTIWAVVLAIPTAAFIFSVQQANDLASLAFGLSVGLTYFGLTAYNALCTTFNELQLMTVLFNALNGTLTDEDGLTIAGQGDDDEENA